MTCAGQPFAPREPAPDEAIAAWKAALRTTPGGQPHYSDLAITTALTLRAVFHLPLRQTEGLIGSILQLLGLEPVPNFSTLSQRAGRVAGRETRHEEAAFLAQASCIDCVPDPVPRAQACWSSVSAVPK
jgi:hypothetical protein